MSTNYNYDQDRNKSNNKKKINNSAKIVLVSGIIALGVFAAAVSTGSQTQTLNAMAQTGNSSSGSSNTNSMINQGSVWQQKIPPSTISTSGKATTKVIPNKFSVTVGVETNGTTAKEAASKNANLMAKVLTSFKDLGIKQNQTETNSYNIYPIYGSKQLVKPCPDISQPTLDCQPGQIIVGYRASNSATVTLDTNGTIGAGEVIDAAVKAGANNINGVYFFISQEKQQRIMNSLIKDAISDARQRAEIAAGAVNMTINGVQSINLNEVNFPIVYTAAPTTAGSLASAPTPILPTQQEVTTTVSIVFYIKNSISGSISFESSQPPSTTVPGMLRTQNNTNCTNPPNGPMIC